MFVVVVGKFMKKNLALLGEDRGFFFFPCVMANILKGEIPFFPVGGPLL